MSTPPAEKEDADMDQDHADLTPDGDAASSDEETIKGDLDQGHIVEAVEEERELDEDASGLSDPTRDTTSSVAVAASLYRQLLREQADASDEASSTDGLPRRASSPINSILSGPDDSPSVQVRATKAMALADSRPLANACLQGSVFSSSLVSSVPPSIASRAGLGSPTPSFRPFDRRFQSRIASPSALSPRPSSPAFLTGHSRNVSLSSQLLLDSGDTETPSPPWEVVRWTKLKKLNGQAFSEAGKRRFGSPTCIAVSDSIILGTTKGIILMFDYHQNLKMIIGPGTKGKASLSTSTHKLSRYVLTPFSCRIRAHHRHRHLSGPYDDRGWSCEWKHLHVGHKPGIPSFSAHIPPRPVPNTRSANGRPYAQCSCYASRLFGNKTHCFGLGG